MPLWLIGMMGSGKSTIGDMVASRLRVPLLDTDSMVESMIGLTVDQVFAAEGEAGFRTREAEAVLKASRANVVVATGGGVVTRPENVSVMRGAGTVVWLRASVETLAERLEHVTNRPLLSEPDRHSTLSSLLAARTPLYADAADFTVDTDRLDPRTAARLVVAMWTA